jgi:pyridoxamine 5'-phosphate oxidase
MSAHDNIFDAPPTDPMSVFDAWLAEAGDSEPNDPNAMTLATVDADGMPNARVVLLKGHDARGFVFYTNLQSQKGGELEATQKASLCFHWKTLGRQVRVQGPTSRVDEQEADAYFASRGRDSRIGAWASQQSRPVADRAALEAAVDEATARFGDGEVPRPPHWSGTRITPLRIEFWRDGAHRLHDRVVYRRARAEDDWQTERLYP